MAAATSAWRASMRRRSAACRALEARDPALQLAEARGRDLRVSGLELQAELAVGGRTDPPLDPRDSLASARDGAARLRDLLLQLVEPEDRLRAGEVDRAPRAEVGREAQNLVHVPLGVVVGEDSAGEIVVSTRGGEVAGRGKDGVVGIPGIGEPVSVRVEAPAKPRVRHELHPPHRAGRARAHVAPEVGLDLVDRGEHLPRHAVGFSRAVPEGEELVVGADGRLLRRHGEREGGVDRAGSVGRLRAREGRRAGRDDGEGPPGGAAREREHR